MNILIAIIFMIVWCAASYWVSNTFYNYTTKRATKNDKSVGDETLEEIQRYHEGQLKIYQTHIITLNSALLLDKGNKKFVDFQQNLHNQRIIELAVTRAAMNVDEKK